MGGGKDLDDKCLILFIIIPSALYTVVLNKAFFNRKN